MKYIVGTKLLRKDGAKGEVVSADELFKLNPKLILSEDICVKWFFAEGTWGTTYDAEYLDEIATIIKDNSNVQ